MIDGKLLSAVLQAAAYFVFACSLTSLFLAVIERWANQWFPNSKFAFVVSAVNDLVSKFGALNLRDHIAPPRWDGGERRGAPAGQGQNVGGAGHGN